MEAADEDNIIANNPCDRIKAPGDATINAATSHTNKCTNCPQKSPHTPK